MDHSAIGVRATVQRIPGQFIPRDAQMDVGTGLFCDGVLAPPLLEHRYPYPHQRGKRILSKRRVAGEGSSKRKILKQDFIDIYDDQVGDEQLKKKLSKFLDNLKSRKKNKVGEKTMKK